MKRTLFTIAMSAKSALGLAACSDSNSVASGNSEMTNDYYYSRTSRITDVINDPVFGDYGRLIFPIDNALGREVNIVKQ